MPAGLTETPILRSPAANGKASRKSIAEVPPEYLGDVVVAVAYDSAVHRGNVYENELRRQALEAWMRADYITASRIAKLIGDADPIEHELADLKPSAVPQITCGECDGKRVVIIPGLHGMTQTCPACHGRSNCSVEDLK